MVCALFFSLMLNALMAFLFTLEEFNNSISWPFLLLFIVSKSRNWPLIIIWLWIKYDDHVVMFVVYNLDALLFENDKKDYVTFFCWIHYQYIRINFLLKSWRIRDDSVDTTNDTYVPYIMYFIKNWMTIRMVFWCFILLILIEINW